MSWVRIPSLTPCDLSSHRNDPEPTLGSGVFPLAACSGRGSGWPAGGLVVAAGVEGELAEEFAGGGVNDADVEDSVTTAVMTKRAFDIHRPCRPGHSDVLRHAAPATQITPSVNGGQPRPG
jgi:hypothetical protein